MKEPWCLAASDGEAIARVIMNYYAKRWTIEPNFRDTKDLGFGMELLRHSGTETLANGQGPREIKNVHRRHFRFGRGAAEMKSTFE